MFYSSEQALLEHQTHINDFFTHHVTKQHLSTPNGGLYYGYAIPKQAHTAILISSGRIEGLDKYRELMWELYKNNYAVFILDHQGQGRSYRSLKNIHKGFVNVFSDYAHDLALFDSTIVNKQWQGKKIILGHSMGGAIAFDYLTRFEHNYSGVFLSAPMFDIYTKGTPKPIAKLVASMACLIGLNKLYAFGQGDYKPEPFALNTLTSSEVRYQLFRQIYQQEPSVQLGGVTYGWLNAAFQFIKQAQSSRLAIPMFIASAQLDTVVDNTAQHTITHLQKSATLETFTDAKHELLFEQDSIRKAVLTRFYEFCRSLT
ncbi:alpha/beta fold hydrolase [Pseudoalteromonas sp. H105]|uniref:alpha/beta fold hydrolase n=1 Tax=Pseudoalteromonas sp. H105 TaxID=1348393 RepID=UPI000732439D|nr:alpha/beta fold hydrolase [Pseudoalteromonas sp. H105]KTF12381.1 lysophospholipase [Pseudoalteromonas sp. H105]